MGRNLWISYTTYERVFFCLYYTLKDDSVPMPNAEIVDMLDKITSTFSQEKSLTTSLNFIFVSLLD